jgi:ATP-dependent exoDNAse (exonuclease V) alpha subunit
VRPVLFNILKLDYNPNTKQVDSKIVARIIRLPFVFAYALTVHKIQGMTLDQLTFNIWGGTFAPGQLYVALSRVKNLEGLCLETPLRKEHVIVSPEVKEYFDTFRCKCLEVV